MDEKGSAGPPPELPSAGAVEPAQQAAAPIEPAPESPRPYVDAAFPEAPPPANVYAPPPGAPPPRTWEQPSVWERVRDWCRGYFLDFDPTFRSALAPFLVVALTLYSRLPTTNYIFDEQEALLANPYVNASNKLTFLDAIHRDFWGLPPDRSIGSYRPIPDFLWRALWQLSKKADGVFRQPFIHHIYNVVFHAVNAAIFTCIVFAWTKRRGTAYMAGLIFVACAVLTEAVSGIVGIADVLGGLGALLALAALSLRGWAMPFGVFLAVTFGLFSKESALVCVPLIPVAALVVAPLTHPERPARFARAFLAFVGAASAFYLYVELRKVWFPSPLPKELTEPLADDASQASIYMREAMVWFHQAPLPKDPLNNPFAQADPLDRMAGAFRVYFRGLTQIVFPKTLSGDYSFPQEPVPDELIFPESVLGLALTLLPPGGSVALWIIGLLRERRDRKLGLGLSEDERTARRRRTTRFAGLFLAFGTLALVAVDFFYFREREKMELPFLGTGLPLWVVSIPLLSLAIGLIIEGLPRLPSPLVAPPVDSPERSPRATYALVAMVAIGLTWTVVAYFPHSNIPVVLPTVRAERFWYFPAIGTTLIVTAAFTAAHDFLKRQAARWKATRWVVPVVFTLFIGFQGVQAYRHAMDYRSDVDFWRATKDAVPRSSKAHLNYSVMKGARGDLETRLKESTIAMELAPKWAMAHIYTGDTLCRLHRAAEAWPHYKEGFLIGLNDQSLISLALQCMYDEKELFKHEDDLREMAAEHEGTWVSFLVGDTLTNHEKNKGVDPKYRPRGYNEGPKD